MPKSTQQLWCLENLLTLITIFFFFTFLVVFHPNHMFVVRSFRALLRVYAQKTLTGADWWSSLINTCRPTIRPSRTICVNVMCVSVCVWVSFPQYVSCEAQYLYVVRRLCFHMAKLSKYLECASDIRRMTHTRFFLQPVSISYWVAYKQELTLSPSI